jgi:hypothetical protein
MSLGRGVLPCADTDWQRSKRIKGNGRWRSATQCGNGIVVAVRCIYWLGGSATGAGAGRLDRVRIVMIMGVRASFSKSGGFRRAPVRDSGGPLGLGPAGRRRPRKDWEVVLLCGGDGLPALKQRLRNWRRGGPGEAILQRGILVSKGQSRRETIIEAGF